MAVTSEPGPPPVPFAESRAASERSGYTAADVHFMQQMIAHHAQALEMTALAPTRTGRREILLLAHRIEESQHGEIDRMRRWLARRGEAVPAADALHDHASGGSMHAPMPGMLSAAELAQLEATRGANFDRLFLDLMIRHHEGALVMVDELFAAPGAGQEPELFQLASDVDADQRAEIARMRRLLAEAAPDTPRSH